MGDNVAEFPITGNETVLDAIAQSGRPLAGFVDANIWIARPAPERRRLRADSAGELGRNQPRRIDGDQLSNDAGRPAVHRRRSVYASSTR